MLYCFDSLHLVDFNLLAYFLLELLIWKNLNADIVIGFGHYFLEHAGFLLFTWVSRWGDLVELYFETDIARRHKSGLDWSSTILLSILLLVLKWSLVLLKSSRIFSGWLLGLKRIVSYSKTTSCFWFGNFRKRHRVLSDNLKTTFKSSSWSVDLISNTKSTKSTRIWVERFILSRFIMNVYPEVLCQLRHSLWKFWLQVLMLVPLWYSFVQLLKCKPKFLFTHFLWT